MENLYTRQAMRFGLLNFLGEHKVHELALLHNKQYAQQDPATRSAREAFFEVDAAEKVVGCMMELCLFDTEVATNITEAQANLVKQILCLVIGRDNRPLEFEEKKEEFLAAYDELVSPKIYSLQDYTVHYQLVSSTVCMNVTYEGIPLVSDSKIISSARAIVIEELSMSFPLSFAPPEEEQTPEEQFLEMFPDEDFVISNRVLEKMDPQPIIPRKTLI